MNPILKKLGFKNQNPVLILNSPDEFESVARDIEVDKHTVIQQKYKLIILFAKSISEVESIIQAAISALDGDGHLWICYPKGTSKKYKSDLNRDRLFELLTRFNFAGVTLVAIDEDWSAFRARSTQFIKSKQD